MVASVLLGLSLSLLVLGVTSIFWNRKSLILILLAIEVVLLAANVGLVSASVVSDGIIGELVAVFVLTVAAAESAIGLAVVVAYYRLTGGISISSINLLQG